MTNPSEVKITDAEVQEFWDNYNHFLTQDDTSTVDDEREWYRKALAAFLARRVPDAMEIKPPEILHEKTGPNSGVTIFRGNAGAEWFNAIRARVLEGIS